MVPPRARELCPTMGRRRRRRSQAHRRGRAALYQAGGSPAPAPGPDRLCLLRLRGSGRARQGDRILRPRRDPRSALQGSGPRPRQQSVAVGAAPASGAPDATGTLVNLVRRGVRPLDLSLQACCRHAPSLPSPDRGARATRLCGGPGRERADPQRYLRDRIRRQGARRGQAVRSSARRQGRLCAGGCRPDRQAAACAGGDPCKGQRGCQRLPSGHLGAPDHRGWRSRGRGGERARSHGGSHRARRPARDRQDRGRQSHQVHGVSVPASRSCRPHVRSASRHRK